MVHSRLSRTLIVIFSVFTVCVACDDESPATPDAGSDADTSGGDAGADCEGGPWEVTSMDGSLRVEIALREMGETADYPDGDALYYRVFDGDEEMVAWSPLGIETDDTASWETGLCVSNAESRDVSGDYTALSGKSLQRSYGGSELTLSLQNVDEAPLEIDFRVHADGAAYRYRLPGEGEVTVKAERSTFRVPAGATGWMAQYDLEGELFAGAYEMPYEEVEAGQASHPRSSWGFPALFEVSDGHWMLFTEADLDETYAGTRLAGEPVERAYRIRFPAPDEGQGVGEAHPTSQLPLTTPWRAIIVGDLATVVRSNFVEDISRPSMVDDTSWIEPGVVAWSWFTQDTGDPALQRQYVDFAERMGWTYVLVDAGWDKWDDPATDVPSLVDYGEQAGVEILLWYNSGGTHSSNLSATPRDRMLDPEVRRAEMEKISGWGVAGIKVDFFDSDKQDRIAQYMGILRDAADNELLVNFHGATLPRGWRRTYPNLMTHEAVRGVEYHNFLGGPTAQDHVYYAFTRNVVGPMDYTPGAFDIPFEDEGQPYGHTLALTVLFESGLQHLSGRADGSTNAGYGQLFEAFPFAEGYLADLPAAWDETRLVDGRPDSHVVLARRNGTEWWIAGVNATESELQIELTLDFLSGASDGSCAVTGDTANSLVEQEETLASGDTLTVAVDAKDGFTCRFAPQ